MRLSAGSRTHSCTCPKKYTYTHNNIYTHICKGISHNPHLRTAALSARPLLRSEEAGHGPGELYGEAGLISKGGTPGSLPAAHDSDGVYGLRPSTTRIQSSKGAWVRSCVVRRGYVNVFLGLFACVKRGRVAEVRKTIYSEDKCRLQWWYEIGIKTAAFLASIRPLSAAYAVKPRES